MSTSQMGVQTGGRARAPAVVREGISKPSAVKNRTRERGELLSINRRKVRRWNVRERQPEIDSYDDA